MSPSLGKLVSRPNVAVRYLCSPLLVTTSGTTSRLTVTSIAQNVRGPRTEAYLVRVHFHVRSFLVVYYFTMVVMIGFVKEKNTV